MIDLVALRALAMVLRLGSFERAARELHVTPSAISQRVRALEDRLGCMLVVRASPAEATPEGARLYRHFLQIELLEADLREDLRPLAEVDPVGPRSIPIAVNADSLATWVLPALQPLVDDGISLELIVDDQDFTHDWLREGRVLGCVSTLAEALRGCRVTPLCTMRYVAVASPAFVERMIGPRGLSHRHLAQVPFVVFNRKDDAQAQWVERALDLPSPRLLQRYVPSSEAYVQAVERGWGIGVAAWPLVRSRVEAGQLQLLRPEVHVPVDLHWHQWKLADAVSAGTARPGLLERIGAALAAGVPQDGPARMS